MSDYEPITSGQIMALCLNLDAEGQKSRSEFVGRCWAEIDQLRAKVAELEKQVELVHVDGKPYHAGAVKQLLQRIAELEQQPRAAVPFDCWSQNDGDSWYEHPADAEFVHRRALGEEFELLAGWSPVRVKYRVTKVPDDQDDDYEVELIAAPPPPAVPAPHDEKDLSQLIDQRDRAEEWATNLAEAIGSHLGVDVGEHSSANCPWANALDALSQAVPAGGVVLDEREAFEREMLNQAAPHHNKSTLLRLDGKGDYDVAWVRNAWAGWQARAVLPSQQQPERPNTDCINCGGAGECVGYEGSGPDIYEVNIICPHCNGSGEEKPPAAPIPWELFPCYLLDECEGDVISEEFLQQALAAMLKHPRYAAQQQPEVGRE